MENKKLSLWKQSKPYLAGLQFALLIAFLATIVSISLLFMVQPESRK